MLIKRSATLKPNQIAFIVLDLAPAGINDPGYSYSVIEIIARIFGDWRKNLWAACDRSRVRHNRFSHATRFARVACNYSRAFFAMSEVICRASVSDADQFLSPSHRDGLQSLITTMFLGIWRAFAVTFFSLCALVENAITIPFFAPAQRLRARAAWLHRWSRFASRVVGIRITTRGSMPPSGLLVSNHLSYLDVIVLSSIRPCVFVAKRDVAGWPFFGWLARAAGTIFVDREQRLSSPAVVDLVRATLASGSVVVLFPEGTSSDGSTVLPFKSALLESAVQLRCPVASASIQYALDNGSVADEVCYWRDMTLVLHLLNLFFKHEIRSRCSFSPLRVRAGNRKEIARELREEIMRMRS
jgi:1-acyl-sn-glycerol-3-phosphate acyltransferase